MSQEAASLLRALTVETDSRFWSQTGYKPGQRLDPRDPQDAKMARVWLDIYRAVLRAAEARGTAHPPAALPPPALVPGDQLEPGHELQHAEEDHVPTQPLPSDNGHGFSKVVPLLVVGGLVVGSVLAKFLYVEVRAYAGAMKMARSRPKHLTP